MSDPLAIPRDTVDAVIIALVLLAGVLACLRIWREE